MIGRDLTQPAQRRRPGRAIMQFDKTQAYMEGENVVMLRSDMASVQMRYEAASGSLLPVSAVAELARKVQLLPANTRPSKGPFLKEDNQSKTKMLVHGNFMLRLTEI